VRIGILGGSFDPVHDGHLALGRAAVRELRLNRIFFVPARLSPFKQSRPPAARRHRLRMLKLALKRVPRSRICDWELRRPGPSYTISTLKRFRREHPRAELFLIVGGDAAATLSRWKDLDRFSRYCGVVSVRRGAKSGAFPGIRRLKARMPAASSSSVRKELGAGRLPGLPVPAPVLRYIRANGLYGSARKPS
jgi:nicotinate-nucleotide adenylyltransferase